jgi:hypothetical protein
MTSRKHLLCDIDITSFSICLPLEASCWESIDILFARSDQGLLQPLVFDLSVVVYMQINRNYNRKNDHNFHHYSYLLLEWRISNCIFYENEWMNAFVFCSKEEVRNFSGLKEINQEQLIQNSQSTWPRHEPTPPEHEAGLLPALPRHSVAVITTCLTDFVVIVASVIMLVFMITGSVTIR